MLGPWNAPLPEMLTPHSYSFLAHNTEVWLIEERPVTLNLVKLWGEGESSAASLLVLGVDSLGDKNKGHANVLRFHINTITALDKAKGVKFET